AVELNANVTVGQKPNLFYSPRFLNSSDFIDVEEALFKRGYYDSDLSDATTMPIISPVVQILAKQRAGQLSEADATLQINALRNNDVRNDLTKYFYQKSVNQQYALNLRGGGANNTYYFSAGYDKDLSNAVGNGYNRVTLNGQNTFTPVKNLELSIGLVYTQSTTKTNNSSTIVPGGTKAVLPPYTQLADASGHALPVVKDFNSAYTDTVGRGLLLDWKYRPLDELKYADNSSKTSDARVNLGLKYSFLQLFSAEIKYQYEKESIAGRNLNSEQSYYTRNFINKFSSINNGLVTRAVPLGGILDLSNTSLRSNRLRAQLNFNKDWSGIHQLTGIAGAEISETVLDNNGNRLYGYDDNNATYSIVDFVNYYPTLPNNSGRIPDMQGISESTDRYVSYFSNLAYTYKQKYTLSASGRIDKSNLFGVNTNQKAVPLYSVGAQWDIDKENFFQLSWLPLLKIRTTYGYNGNINKSVSAFTTATAGYGSVYYSLPNASLTNPANPELKWEKVRMLNLGVDYALKGNVVSGSLEYYWKKGLDLFGDIPLAPSTGWPSFFGNRANTSGHGADIVINTKNIDKAIKWNTNFILSYATDKVTNYAVKATSTAYINGFGGNNGGILPLQGKPLFAYYSYKWAGLNAATGDPQGYLNGKVSNDYSGIITNTTVDSMIYNGPSRPTVFGSLRNTFSWKGFSLSFNMIFKLGYY
ncbi:MAG TPA: SusC/RagA family TonB-linked outer membrane protein, partial [Mucilaginibacter sp.]